VKPHFTCCRLELIGLIPKAPIIISFQTQNIGPVGQNEKMLRLDAKKQST
jgi:hypothetical protein